MPVRYDDPRPPYQQLAAELRDAIHQGVYEPGDKLPSTRELADANDISQVTVQHALSVLRDEGLIVGQQGRGVFVQDPAKATARDTKQGAEADGVDEEFPLAKRFPPAKDRLDETRLLLEEALGLLGDYDLEPDADLDQILAETNEHIAAANALLKARGHSAGPAGPEPPPPAPDVGPDIGP